MWSTNRSEAVEPRGRPHANGLPKVRVHTSLCATTTTPTTATTTTTTVAWRCRTCWGSCCQLVRVTSPGDLTSADCGIELVLIWHEHRLPILLSALVVATIARLAIYARDRRGKLSASPGPLSPIEERQTVELKPEWLPEYTTTVGRPDVNTDNHAEDDTGAVALVAKAKAKKGPKTVKGRRMPKARVREAAKLFGVVYGHILSRRV
jgi:hypothetical protein